MEKLENERNSQDETPEVIGMEYMLIQKKGDKEIVTEQVKEFLKLSKQELVDRYNRQVEIGIVGVRAQSLMICALGYAFEVKFGKSPVSFIYNMILGLTGKIILKGDDYEYVKQ